MQPPQSNSKIAGASKALVIIAFILVLVGWMLTTPPSFSGKTDAIGYALCHQIPERSFHIGDYQLPLCARCSGMYLGAVLGLGFQAMHFQASFRRMPPWRVIIPLALLVLAFALMALIPIYT